MAHIDSSISTGRRLYVRTKYGEPIVDRLKALGAHWDAEQKAWWVSPTKRPAVEALLVGADQQEDDRVAKGEPPPKEDPSKITLTGKATYKGRTYYVRTVTRDNSRARLITLDQSLDFWAPLGPAPDQAQITKAYEPRMVGRGKWAREERMTLRAIQRFIERQANPETRRGECTECGHWGPSGEPCTECGGEGTHM